jgi:hypothetical protein
MDFLSFFFPTGSPNMSDVMVTLSTIIGGIVMTRQKAKDDQIRVLQEENKSLREKLDHCYQKREELADKKYQ